MEVWIFFSSSGCSIGKQHNGVLVLMKRKGRIRQTVKVYNCHFPQVFLAIGECQCLRSIPESSSCEWQRAETERENGGRKRKKRKCAPGENDVCSVQSLHHFHLTWPPIRPSMHIVHSSRDTSAMNASRHLAHEERNPRIISFPLSFPMCVHRRWIGTYLRKKPPISELTNEGEV